MIFIYILVGLGIGLAQNWAQILEQALPGHVIDDYIAVMMSSFVYYKLCIKLPDQAVSYLTGRLSMGFDSAASVNAALSIPKRTYEVGKKIDETYKKVKDFATGKVADWQGNAKAHETARQAARAGFEAQGKSPSLQDIEKEAIKTLGEARREMKQAEWDKVVDATQGGKVAKNILDGIPKPKKETKKKTKKDANEDFMI